MEETLLDSIRILVTLGITGLLIFLRTDAERFGMAEYHEMQPDGRFVSLLRRVGWTLTGLALIGVVMLVYPDPAVDLNLRLGASRYEVVLYGFVLGGIATAHAIAFALLRYGRIRFPPLWSYPTAILNAIATAFIDEVTFRGLLLGFLLMLPIEASVANLIQTLVYALSTRLGAPGRDKYMLVVALLLGYATGWVTIATAGIGAAFMGHAVHRFALFVCTGHAGVVAPRGREVEDEERVAGPPTGWRQVGPKGPGSV